MLDILIISDTKIKGNTSIIFLCNPQKSSIIVSHANIEKCCSKKKVILCFYNLREEVLKVAAFVIFSTSIMVLLGIHQRFKGHSFERIAHYL